MEFRDISFSDMNSSNDGYHLNVELTFHLSEKLSVCIQGILYAPRNAESIMDYTLSVDSDTMVYSRDRGQGFRTVKMEALTLEQQNLVSKFRETANSRSIKHTIDSEILMRVQAYIHKYEKIQTQKAVSRELLDS